MYPMKAVCALPGQRAGVGGLDKTVRSALGNASASGVGSEPRVPGDSRGLAFARHDVGWSDVAFMW